MLEITQLFREFLFNGVKFADPGPALTVEQVKDFYANVHPDLLNAQVEGPKIVGDKHVYEFRRAVGTKGARRPDPAQVAKAQAAIARYASAEGFSISGSQRRAADALADLADTRSFMRANAPKVQAPSPLLPLLP